MFVTASASHWEAHDFVQESVFITHYCIIILISETTVV